MLQLCGISSVDEVASPVENGVRHAFRVFGVSPTFSSVLLVFVLLSAIQAVLLYVQAIIDGKLKHGFSRTLRVELYSAMNLATWESQAGTRTADVAHALSVEVDRIQGGVASLLALASGIVLVSAFAVVSMAVAPGMSLLAIIGCTLFWPLLLYPNRLAKRSGSRLTQRARGFYRQVLDQLGGLKESKLLSAEERHILLFHKLAGDIRTAGMEFERAKGATNFVFSFCAGVSLCIMLYVGTEYLRTPAVDLLVLVVVFSRLIPKLNSVQAEYQRVIQALPAFTTVCLLQQKYQAATESAQTVPGPLVVRDGITLQNVHFRYGNAQRSWALYGVDLAIPAQKTTAIIGASGAGKSTIADVLLGLLVPQSGDVLVDGRTLNRGMLNAWRNTVGYVPQEPFLLNDTIKENLLWGKPDATDFELEEALRLSAMERVVAELPAGLETVVGDRGVNLSGGERQRITLARAMLRRPSVLVLDEATSSLDAENQTKIMASLRSLHGSVTVILIAHRMSTIHEADQIVILDNGRVVGQGKYDELCATSDRFRRLINKELLSIAS
ncbi:MAG: ABC transporter ATP-binding protein [Planctomycetaceae bacterium]